MIRRNKSKSIVDLTPLLDVVLILLFALLMTMSFEQDVYKAEAAALDEQLEESDLEMEEMITLVEEQEKELDQLKEDISIMEEQKDAIDEALLTWFGNKDVTSEDIATSSNFAKIFDVDKTNQSLYQMNFVANQFFYIEIEIDPANNYSVMVNGKTSSIQLTQEKIGDQEQIDRAYNDLYDLFEKELVSRNGGYNYVLFTLIRNGDDYRYGPDLIWLVLKDIEEKQQDQRIYKVQYLNYN